MSEQTKAFHSREGECPYCDFEGIVLLFENGSGEGVEICSGCVETSLEEFYKEGHTLREPA